MTKKIKVVFPAIKYVVVNPLITTIIWSDDTTTEVKCGNDPFDEEKAVLWAVAKKALGGSTEVSDAIALGKLSSKENFGKFKK
jgi:hypothetical protein